jgi:hypothetical protein
MANFMQRVFAVALLSTGIAASALAQQPAAPAAPVPAARPQLSAAHLAVASDIVRLSGMSRSIDIIVPGMVERAKQLFVQSRPELSGQLVEVIKTLDPEFKKQTEEAIRIAANAFGNRLSEAELQELKTFFSSAIGKKFVESQPAIVEEMFRNLDDFQQRLSQIVVDRIRDEMKKKGHTL